MWDIVSVLLHHFHCGSKKKEWKDKINNLLRTEC